MKYDITGEIDYKGVRIHYEYFGKKEGPVLVLLNGIAMETTSWYQFLPPILEKVDVLLWDFRGQGKSSSDDTKYSFEEFADYFKAIIDELKIPAKNVNILGVSVGAILASEILRKYSYMINKAILSGVILSNEKLYKMQAEEGKKIISRGLIDIWIDSLYITLFSESFLRTIESFIPKLKEALYNRYKDRKNSLLRLIEAEENYLLETENYYIDYKKIETPILLITGEYDRITPPYIQKKILKIFPNVRYIEHAECGHIVFMERPKEFFYQVIDFIAR